jgi:RNA binding exosome subunit
MSEILRQQITDYLQDTDSELKIAQDLELPELVDVLIDRANDAELEYAILSYAYSSSVPVENFEGFHGEVISKLEALAEGEQAADDFMDAIAEKYL